MILMTELQQDGNYLGKKKKKQLVIIIYAYIV